MDIQQQPTIKIVAASRRTMPLKPRTPREPRQRAAPILLRREAFFYPRWPLLAAYICNGVGCLGYLYRSFVPCSVGPLRSLCSMQGWPDWLQVTAIWLAFLLCWFIAYFLGGSLLDAALPQRSSAALPDYIRSISNFEPLRPLLIGYAMLVMGSLVVLWLLERIAPIPFALAIIVIFVTSWTCLYKPRVNIRS